MALTVSQPKQANQVEEREPKDPGLPADYLRWISFEGCCSPATEPAEKAKVADEPEAQRERTRAIQAPLKALRGSE